jgi:aryl-alcohol dehydrogenase-like predicted oxidoreductase
MEHRNLGRSGLKVSSLWLGTANFGREINADECFAVMDRSYAAGITCIDTANGYSRGAAEEIVGRWVAERGLRRELVLGTKVQLPMGDGPNERGLSRRHIMEQAEASLRRLKTDYIDLYQAHFPDTSTPLDETLRTFDDLVHSGKVRYIGCSNYDGWQIMKAAWVSERLGLHSYASTQLRYNTLWRLAEPELLPACADLGIGVLAYSPTGGGFLTGRYTRDSAIQSGSRFAAVPAYKTHYWKEDNFRFVEAFADYCRQRGVGMAEMAIAWVASHPAVTATLIGVHTLEHLAQALRAQEIKLTPQERDEISNLGQAEADHR